MFKRGKHAAEEELPVEEVADVEVVEAPVEAVEEGQLTEEEISRQEELDKILREFIGSGEDLMPVPESTVTSPSYYQYPGGIQMRDITRWHTGNGAQAIQYIGRATRFDLVTKSHSEEGRIEDIDKAINFLEDEKKRLKGEF